MANRKITEQKKRLWNAHGIKTFLSYGFRPFFLAAGIYAMLPMFAWLVWIGVHAAGGLVINMTIAEPPHIWHGHEMVYGFASAAVAGFLLTAVPNWTGTQPFRGASLGILFAIWISGRAAMWFSAYLPTLLVAILDAAFLLSLLIVLTRQLALRPVAKNIVFAGFIGLLFAGNLVYHLDRLNVIDDGAPRALHLGLLTLVLMITVIGGRVVPAFTRNSLKYRGPDIALPKSFPILDGLSIGTVLAYLILATAEAGSAILGATAISAAITNGLRLSFWRSKATFREPIVWVLHLGYGWLVLGFLLLGLAHFFDILNTIAARHALATGAVGTMMMAIMTRAALGHTGRALVAPRPIALAYLLISLTALLRAIGPSLAPRFYNELMFAAGVSWIIAFAIFVIIFAPILLGPRLPRQASSA
ncbi:hypothetical protein MnTg02_01047 [bacterium MnTg02]|nr:hypothetical protein MnTg02_01047 [bacterium MnTg02]